MFLWETCGVRIRFLADIVLELLFSQDCAYTESPTLTTLK